MNNIEKGKKSLKNLGVLSLVVNIVAIVIGAVLMILGAIAIGDSKVVQGIIEIVIGIGFCALAVVSLIIGVVATSTSSAMKATKGSVVDENLAHGTMNATLCGKCGTVLSSDSEFCPKCGDTSSKVVKCACGIENDKDAQYCVRCGAKLK